MNTGVRIAAILFCAAAAGAGEGEKKVVASINAVVLYKKNCAACHGADAKGNPAMAKMFKARAEVLNLVDEETLAKKDEDLAKIIVGGKGKMPSYKGKLSEEETRALMGYLRSLKAPE